VSELVRRRVLVSGRVQGVYFRQSTADEAAALGVAGWVRNLPDGRVEAVFEGARELVDTAIAWCGVGPARAHVEAVDVTDEAPEGLIGFRLRY
jgi:acylphosphatase